MSRMVMAAISDRIWKPIAQHLITALIASGTAYAIDRGFFDAQMAHTIANHLLAFVNEVLR